jgi:hypothetical protein
VDLEIFWQIPGPRKLLFRAAAGCVFVHDWQGEVTTAQVDTCTVYWKNTYMYPSVPNTAVRVRGLNKLFWKVFYG